VSWKPDRTGSFRNDQFRSGLDVLKIFRQTPATANLLVLLASGVDDVLMAECIDDLKVFASFAKPFSPALVEKKIEEAFGGVGER
jgi:hypothetical protein